MSLIRPAHWLKELLPKASLCLCLLLLLVTINIEAMASDNDSKLADPAALMQQNISETHHSSKRIVSLSPHLTELVFALGAGEQLVAVSDYSDYPAQAKNLPSVASYEGANIAEIIRLKASHVLVWRGGNKDIDIQKLKHLGFNVFESSIVNVNDLIANIAQLGRFLEQENNANTLNEALKNKLFLLQQRYTGKNKNIVYYMGTQPLIGLGSDPWLNDLLHYCGLNNLYKESLGSYPQLQMADVVRKNPDLIIAAGKYSKSQIEEYWAPHKSVMSFKLAIADPDALHRFTPRSIDEIIKICKRSYD